jgi:DNA-binding FrmR family transcriptional regulator
MQPSTRAEIIRRLKSVEGHVRGIQKMVEEDRYCIDLLKQTAAVKGALDRLDAVILANHLDTCVTRAVRSADESERERVIGELLDLYHGQASGKWGRAKSPDSAAACHQLADEPAPVELASN